jgi:hypothetical protein
MEVFLEYFILLKKSKKRMEHIRFFITSNTNHGHQIQELLLWEYALVLED